MSISFNPSSSASQPPQSGYIPPSSSIPQKTGGGAGRGCLSGFIGFVLFFLLNITFFLYLLNQISDKPFLTKIGTDTLGTVYDQNPEMFDNFLKPLQAELKKNQKSQPFPELKVTITKQEIAGLSDREIIIYIATNKFIDPLYEKGDAYAQSISKTGESPKASGTKKKLKADTFEYEGKERTGFYFLSREFHETISSRYYIFLGVSIALLAALLFINTGYGRLSSIGVTLVVSSLPLMGIYLTFTALLKSADWIDMSDFAVLLPVMTKLLDPFIELFRNTFLIPLVAGAILIVAAIFVSAVSKSQGSHN
ncbi:MAG: hypothetical protein A2Y33_02835 [Spirochaetes bacterium GWF1_51_8]|nr:MAG: hypothetical protein A2Y33_02835 [Spirochaetes bacterium GWF1_51_8]